MAPAIMTVHLRREPISTCMAAKTRDIVMDVSEAAEEWWVQQVITNVVSPTTPRTALRAIATLREMPSGGTRAGTSMWGVLSYYEHVNAIGDSLGQHFEFS